MMSVPSFLSVVCIGTVTGILAINYRDVLPNPFRTVDAHVSRPATTTWPVPEQRVRAIPLRNRNEVLAHGVRRWHEIHDEIEAARDAREQKESQPRRQLSPYRGRRTGATPSYSGRSAPSRNVVARRSTTERSRFSSHERRLGSQSIFEQSRAYKRRTSRYGSRHGYAGRASRGQSIFEQSRHYQRHGGRYTASRTLRRF